MSFHFVDMLGSHPKTHMTTLLISQHFTSRTVYHGQKAAQSTVFTLRCLHKAFDDVSSPFPTRAGSLLRNRRMTHEHGNEWGTQTQMKWGKCLGAGIGYALLKAEKKKKTNTKTTPFKNTEREKERSFRSPPLSRTLLD